MLIFIYLTSTVVSGRIKERRTVLVVLGLKRDTKVATRHYDFLGYEKDKIGY
jgi:hypothetical protein